MSDRLQLAGMEVTDQRRMEQALRDSEARLRSVVNSAPMVLWAVDARGVFTFSDGRGLEALGLHPDEVVGRSIFDTYRDVPQVLDDVRRVLAGEEFTSTVEVGGLTFEVRYSTLRDDAHAVTGAIGVAIDVTERLRAERCARDREERAARFQAALMELAKADDAAVDEALRRIVRVDADALRVERVGVWFFDADGEALRCRTLFTRTDGAYDSGMSLLARDLPDYFAHLRERRVVAAHDAVADPATHEFADSYLRPMGITSMLDVPIWRGGEMVGVVCHEHTGPAREWGIEEQDFAASVADLVTLALESADRAAAERAARESEARKAAIVASSLDCIVTLDRHGRILEFNPAAESTFGHASRDATGREFVELAVPERLRARHRRALARLLEGRGSRFLGRRFETIALRADGVEIPVELTLTRISCGGEPMFTCFLRDVTSRREAEAALRAAEREAKRTADRMRAVATAAAGVIGAESLEALQTVLRDACCCVISFDAFTFALYDEAAHTLSYLPGFDAGVFVPAETISAAGVPSERAIRERRSLVTLRADDPAGRGTRLMGTGHRSESIVRTPVVSGDRVLAVLAVHSYRADAYGPADVEVLEALASLAAGALDAIRLAAERRAAEEALRISETRFRTVFEQFPLSLQVFSPDGETLEVNRAWSELFGIGREQLGGFNPLHDPQLADIGDFIRRGFAGETLLVPPSLFDTRRLGAAGPEAGEAGGKRWIQAFICPVKEPDGTVREVFLIHQDVTTQKEAEAVLQSAHAELEQRVEERTAELAETNMALEEEIAERLRAEEELLQKSWELEAVFRALPDLYFRLDADGTVRDYQAGSDRRLLLPPGEFLGRRMQDVLPPGAAQRFSEGLAEVASTGELVCVEYPLRVPDGERDFEARLLPFLDGQVVMVVRDITEQKEAERALQRSEQHFRRLIENSSDVATILDRNGNNVYQSPSLSRVFGYTPEDMLGTPAFDRIHPDDAAAARRALGAMLTSPGTVHSAEFRYRHKDGSWRVVEAMGRTLLPDSPDEGVVINARDITERKEAEEALRRSEERFRALIENASDLITILEPDGTLRYQSPAVTPLFGYTPEEMAGHSAFEWMHPDDVPATIERLTDVATHPGTTYRTEFRFLHKDGSWRTVEAVGRTLSPTSAEAGIVVNSRDVTERRQVERALRASEESYRGLFDALTELVYLQDLEGRFINVNEAVVKAYGYTREEIVGQTPALLADPERVDVADTMERFRRTLEGEPQRFEWWGRRKDGSIFPKEVVLKRSTYFGQDVVIAVARDVTERKAIEDALIRQKAYFEEILDSTDAGISVFDRAGRFEYISPSAIPDPALRQWSIGKTVREYCREKGVLPDVCEQRQRSLDLAIAERRAHEFEQEARQPDGSSRHMLRRILPLLDEAGEVTRLIGYSMDITERKRAEAAMQQAKEEAERANRAKSEFLSRMSHELRTPMNSILGFAQVLARRGLPPDQHRAVEHVLKAGRHLLNLINEVLDIARIEANRQPLSLEPVSAASVLHEAASLIRPLAAERGCTLEEVPACPRYVRADRQRLTQVLLNLLSNAVKYNRPGGSVRLACRVVEGVDGERLRIEVQDTGPGIAPERMAELFVPFARLGAESTQVEGTGLGLALSQRLTEAMGGRLEVESRPGEGCTFTVELPVVDSPLERMGGAGLTRRLAAAGGGPARPATLLYVEDNLANLSLVETILASRPEVTLVSALQGRLGLDLAREHAPDVVLLDLHLPDLPGDEVLRRLRADPRTRDVPVVVISADAMPRSVDHLLELGAFAYLTKPLDLDSFLETLDRALAARKA
jgi:PAS domain S-box-containing protein